MKTVVCFGETLIDLLDIGSKEEGAINTPIFRQFPGGAPANVAAAIGKLGGRVKFAGQVGDDAFGHFLINALIKLEVDTTHLSLHNTAKTALAFVFLDDTGERSFEFYRDHTADMIISRKQVVDDWFTNADIFHFCSNTLTESNIADTTYYAIGKASNTGLLVSFDINLRHALWKEKRADIEVIKKCFWAIDIIKITEEELNYLDRGGEKNFAEKSFARGVKIILITNGGKPIKVHTPDFSLSVRTPKVDVVDTTAAGDAFMGGFLYALSTIEDPEKALTIPERVHSLTQFAGRCGAISVTRQGAFSSLPSLTEVDDILL